MSWELKRDSLSKCWVRFTDGNTGSFFSYDWLHSQSRQRDKALGRRRLMALVKRWEQRVDKAIIFDRQSDLPVAYYRDGRWDWTEKIRK